MKKTTIFLQALLCHSLSVIASMEALSQHTKKLTVLVPLLVFNTFCSACPDVLPIVPPSSQQKLHQSYEIRFGVLHQLMMVQATVNNIDGYLCIDTGTKGLILNEQFFHGVWRNEGIMNSDGDIVSTESVLASVQLGRLDRTFRDAKTANLYPIFKKESKLVLGMIGWEIFKNNEILIDYLNARIIVYVLDDEGNKIENSKQTNPVVNSIPLKVLGQFLIITAEVGDKKMNLILDSGATSNVICKSLYQNFQSNNVLVKKVKIRQWGGSSVSPIMTKFGGMQIGHIPLLPMKTMWYSLTSINFLNKGSEIDGIIGQELFKQYQVGINFRKNEITLYNYKNALVKSSY